MRMSRWIVLLVLLGLSVPSHAEWQVVHVSGQPGRCQLGTDPVQMFDGYGDTKLALLLVGDALLVRTDSNVDLSFNDVGLKVDGKEFIAADAVADEKDIVFRSELESIVDQFIKGRRVTLYLRFWPTYPPTQLFQTQFSLIGFTKAYKEYQTCRG
jgi:hypothetical protein